MKVNLKIFDVTAVIYAIKDFSFNKGDLEFTINEDFYEISFKTKEDEGYFLTILNDYMLRVKVALEVKDVKQKIIQTALYDLIEDI